MTDVGFCFNSRTGEPVAVTKPEVGIEASLDW